MLGAEGPADGLLEIINMKTKTSAILELLHFGAFPL